MDEGKCVILKDEMTGEKIKFSVLQAFIYKKEKFLFVIESDLDDSEEEIEVYILKEVSKNDEELTYEILKDQKKIDELVDFFEEKNDNYNIKK